MKIDKFAILLLMFFGLSCGQKSNVNNNLSKKSYEKDSVPCNQNRVQIKDSLFGAFCQELDEIQMPFSSKSSQIPLNKVSYPEIIIDTSKIFTHQNIRKFYQVLKDGNPDEYIKSTIYALGRIPTNNQNITGIVYLYQNSNEAGFSYMRPEPEIELLTYNSDGVIIDRLLLHYFDCGDGIKSKSFTFNNDTIKVKDFDESWNETFTQSDISMSINLYSINDNGKIFLIDKKQHEIDNIYDFDREEIYESVFLNRNFPRTKSNNIKFNNKNEQTELFYHTWSPPVGTIKNNEKIFYISLPEVYGDYVLMALENEDKNYFIKKQDIICD